MASTFVAHSFQMKRTPLHLACRNGNMDMFIFLLQKGADYEARDKVSKQNCGTIHHNRMSDESMM
jgi:hypothetical protein